MKYSDKLVMSDKDETRFASKFNLPEDVNGCWEWKASKNRKGYGQIKIGMKLQIATRVMYKHVVGDIPSSDMFVCHHCDNPSCVNPKHLFLGTNTDNRIDMEIKGRPCNGSVEKTHCPQGHEYSASNTYRKPNGWRVCRKCQHERGKARDLKNKLLGIKRKRCRKS